MQKILLYYKFVPVADPEAMRLWQHALCEKLNLKGRILIAGHGINGTVGGNLADLKTYSAVTRQHPSFKDMKFKWSDGAREHFPKLSVKVRPEIISFGVADMIKVNDRGIVGGGKHLRPKQVHELVKRRSGDVIFFDGRNAHEAAVGKFKDAVVPNVTHTRDFIKELEDPRYDAIKDKPIVTYCTGGIRCEVLSLVMKQRGFKEVYQLDGGIQTYGEQYGDDGLWEGSLYVFDGRMSQQFSDHAAIIGQCEDCAKKTNNYENCANKACNKLILICPDCYQKTRTCGIAACQTKVATESLP